MAFERLKFARLWTVDDETEEKGFRTYQDSETKVREDLQYHPDAILSFLNEKLLPALESEDGAENIGVFMEGSEATTLAEALSYIVGEFMRVDGRIDNVVENKFPDDMTAKELTFEETDWASGGGLYTITVPKSVHTRSNSRFGYQLWSNGVNGPVSDSWAVNGTSVTWYDNGNIVLAAEEPYAGRIAFFGV